MATPVELRSELRKTLLEAFSAEYAATVETWKMLESKAQASVTISGIFFAAAFAYAREATVGGAGGRVLLLLCIVALLVSVLCALLSLQVRKVPTPPLGTFIESTVTDLTKLPDETLSEDNVIRFVNDRVKQWRAAIDATIKANEGKAASVWRSQVALVIAMFLAAVFTVVRVS